MGVTVRERPEGSGVWWVFINHAGRRKAKKIGKEKTALDVAEKIKARLVLGDVGVMKKDAVCPTFTEYAERWLAMPHDWKESTREGYSINLRLHILPVFGKERLDQIGRKELRAFFDGLAVNGFAPASISGIRSVISSILVHAVEQELIPANPLHDIKIRGKGTGSKEQIDPLTEQEAFEVLAQAKKYRDGAFYPALLCGLRTGMRIGELQALQWGDVDFAGGFIDVKRSHRKKRITSPKSGKRKRVDMSPHLAETLRALKAGRKVVSLQEDGWVFADEQGRMLHRKNFEAALRRCLEWAGLRRIRVHDLRHSYATVRLLKGHNVIDVSRQLGHANPTITLKVYAHWIPGKFKSQVAELDTPQVSATPAQLRQFESATLSGNTT
jgi:integrase